MIRALTILVAVLAVFTPALAQNYPTNLFHFRVPDNMPTNLVGVIDSSTVSNTPVATNDLDRPLPLVCFSDVPITTAIDNLARTAGINYQLDPRCKTALEGASDKNVPEPLITLTVKNIHPRALLDFILASNGLVLVENPITTVASITSPDLPGRTLDENLAELGNNTLGGGGCAIPLISFNEVPIYWGLKNLARQDGTIIHIDPGLDEGGRTLLTLRWQNLTARQAILALCQNYDLKIVPTNPPGSVVIQAWTGDYPTNLLHFNVADEYLPKAKLIVLSTNPVSGRSPTNVLSAVYFDDAPMLMAIKNLVEQGKINYLIDPHYRHVLLGGSKYHPGDQKVNLRLKNTSVEDVFTAMLKPRGFVVLDDPVSGISLITRYSHRPYVLDGALLHMETNVISGTNGIYCPVSLDDVPVDLALTHLLAESRLKIKLDNDVTNDGYWSLNMHTERTTAKQAIYAICQACEYEIVQDDDGRVVIRHKPMKHYHHAPIH